MRSASTTGRVRPVLDMGMRRTAALLALLLAASALFSACGDGDAGLTRADVEEIVRAEMAAAPTSTPGVTFSDVDEAVSKGLAEMPSPEPGLSRSEVEKIVRAAIADVPQPRLTEDEARLIARAAIADIPPRSAPAEYTRFFVDSAIARYETQGLESTLSHYNREESVDGQWYVFIMDENDLVIAHPDPDRRGLDVKGWVGTDDNGYNFGPEMLSATEEGKWVSYVYRNPENGTLGSGAFELKNVWVERRDELLFASGWYIDADEFTRRLVSVAVDNFREGGLPATVDYFASPGSALAGLEAAIDYYNAAETVEGKWFAFIGDPSGKIVAHSNASLIGGDVQDLLGGEPFDATEEGLWVTSEALRVYVAGYGGFVFGSGWSRGE